MRTVDLRPPPLPRRAARGPFLLLAGLVAAPALLGLGRSARGGEEGPVEHLRWRRTYAEALLEGRTRNVPVLVTRQKDECGRCRRMHRDVLTDHGFVRWANEHVVVLVAHDERGHDARVVERADGSLEEVCPLYPGLTCRDHVHAAVDVDNAREEGLVAIPFVELCPNTWLVLPDDDVRRVPEKDQFDPTRVRALVEEAQEGLGATLDPEVARGVAGRLVAAEEATDEGRYREALEAILAVSRAAPTPATGLWRLVERRWDALEEDVSIAAEDALEAEEAGAEEVSLARRLLAAVDIEVYGRRLPVHARLAAWLAAR